jgi:hypothetical protein
MTSYWDLHIAYVRECEKLNWANDIDPHHYKMEWHHILPQCLFGDQPIGAWLTLRQHAIASCLQSIALRKVCFCGWHQKFVPTRLWGLANETTSKERSKNSSLASLPSPQEQKARGLKAAETNRRNGTGVFAIGVASLGAAAVHAEKDKDGKSKHAKRGGTLACAVINKQRWEDPDHPELGQHRPNTLVLMQKRRGLPHGKENRRRVK